MDGGARQATVHEVLKSWIQLSDSHAYIRMIQVQEALSGKIRNTFEKNNNNYV